MATSEQICCVCLITGNNFESLTKKDTDNISLLNKFKKCIWEVLWLPSFYVCEACYQTLVIVHTFREKCIASDLARKVLENKLSVDNHLNTEKYSQCKEESFRTEELKNEIEGDADNLLNGSDFLNESAYLWQDSKSKQEIEAATSSSPTSEHERKKDQNHMNRDLNKIANFLEEFDESNLKTETVSKASLSSHCIRPSAKRKRKRKFGCEICERSFLSSTKLILHCTKEHGMSVKDVKPFSCESCSQRFHTSSNLWQHVKYHEGVKSNMCSYCGKGFITKTDLFNHEKKHLNMREYKCEACSKSFNTHKDIRSHKLIVHTDSSKWKYVCKICSKPFPIKSNYDSHMRRHIGDKKFPCHLCEKKFTTKCDLQRHLRSHTDVRDHPCLYCDKEYKDERVLKVHMAKAHGIGLGKVKIPVRARNYVCHFCSKAYFAKNKLTRHLYTHSGEKPFGCPICDKKFNDKSYVKQHLRNTHNVEQMDLAEQCMTAKVEFFNVHNDVA